MKFLTPFLLLLITSNLYAGSARVSDLVPVHPFSRMKTIDDFAKWCETKNLSPFADYAKTLTESEFFHFLDVTQRVLSRTLGKFLVIDQPESILKFAWAQYPGDIESAVASIYQRSLQDLDIYRPVQRSYYNYALIDGVIFSENRTLDRRGKLKLVLGPWQLDPEHIDNEYVKASFANQIIAMDPSLGEFSSVEQQVIQQWHTKYKQIIEQHYSGHNSKLKEIVFTEFRSAFSPRRGTIDDFVQELAFTDTEWWFASSSRVPGENVPATELSGAYSRSLVRRYGKEATRVIFWPKENKDYRPMPVLGQLHFAINYDAKKRMRSLEVLVKDPSGEIQPFLYEKVNVGLERAWLPVNTFGRANRPVKQVCFNCHGDRNDGQMKFPPHFLKNETEMQEDGYRSDYIIQELLKL